MAQPIVYNYTRMFADKLFMRSVTNTFLYLIIQVPIMLIFAILLAQLLNNRDLKFRGLFRTCVFLPCATALVSYSLIFKSLFATQGLINTILQALHITSQNINFLGTAWTAKMVIIIALITLRVFRELSIQSMKQPRLTVQMAGRLSGTSQSRFFGRQSS